MRFLLARRATLALASVTLITAACNRRPDAAPSAGTGEASASNPAPGLGERFAELFLPAKKAVIPAGTAVRISLAGPVSSATAKPGDRFEATVAEPVVVEGVTVVPSGSRVEGHVVNAVSSGRLARTASLELELTRLTVPAGETVSIRTSRLTRAGKEHAPRNVGIIGGGAAVGAILGQAIGRNSTTTLEGAAAGAAAGTGVAAATGELDVTLAAGRELSFRLEAPVTVTVPRRTA